MYLVKRLLLYVLFSINFILNIYGQYEIQDQSNLAAQSLHEHASLYGAGQDELSLSDVEQLWEAGDFAPLKKAAPTLNYTDDHWWVHISLDHQSLVKQSLFLETGRPIIDFVDLYLIDQEGNVEVFHNGDAIPWTEKSFEHRKILFPLELEALSEYEVFIHYKSDGEIIDLPLVLKSTSLVIGETYATQFLFGIFFGILILAIITYLFFFFALKDKSFLYYSIYVSVTGFLQLSWDGYFYQYFAPNGGYLNQRIVLISALLVAYLLGRYTQILLQTKAYTPKINRSFWITNVALGIMLLLVLLVPASIPIVYYAANAIALVILIIALVTIGTYYTQGYPIDHFFVAGISILIMSYCFFILNNLSILPNSFFTNNIIKIGTGFEVIFLSITMSRRIRKMKSEKEKMQSLALRRAEEMSDLKSYYLSNMSHELRTPLNAIMGISDHMIEELDSPEIRQNFETIRSVSVGLLSSVNDVLDFSKLEKGELVLNEESFSLKQFLDGLCQQTRPQVELKNLAFEFEYTQALSQKVIGDPSRLCQVLNNLLANAIKFTSEGTVSLKVSHQISKSGSVNVDFVISDTGIGISPEKQATIFEALMQEDISNKRKYGGFGMGLFIVKSLLDLFDGRVDLESELCKGSVFKVSIPFELAPIQDQTLEKNLPKTKDLDGAKILVVEDNPLNQMVVESILKKWKNTTVYTADDGSECIDILKEKEVDIVLMDLQMPVMDGYEATLAIRNGTARNQHKSLPILALTADITEKSRLYCFEIGMNDYMTKPINPQLLYQKIVQHLPISKTSVS